MGHGGKRGAIDAENHLPFRMADTGLPRGQVGLVVGIGPEYVVHPPAAEALVAPDGRRARRGRFCQGFPDRPHVGVQGTQLAGHLVQHLAQLLAVGHAVDQRGVFRQASQSTPCSLAS